METHWREMTVGDHGELVLEGLPFRPGQAVEVVVFPKAVGDSHTLRNSVLEYREPFEPIAGEDWDACR